MEEEMTTIRDVAADAGVSVGTVSKVLNNLYVKPGNREKVEASIRKLDYRVKGAADPYRGNSHSGSDQPLFCHAGQ